MTTTTATTVHVVDTHTAVAVADHVNQLHREGREVRVNGRVTKSAFGTGDVAKSWSNGSVSVDVVATTRGARTGTVWAKAGETLTVEVA